MEPAPDQIARQLLKAPTAALAYIDGGMPAIARIGTAFVEGQILVLLSELSHHSKALRLCPTAALLFGDATQKGDPLTQARLSLKGTFFERPKEKSRTAFLAVRPKSKLYYDFTDFHLFRFEVASAFLNGGFGRAHDIEPQKLAMG